MLTQQWRRLTILDRSLAITDGARSGGCFTCQGVLNFTPELARFDLRIVKHLLEVIDRAARHTNSTQLFNPFITGACFHDLDQDLDELITMLQALTVINITWVFCQIRTSDDLTISAVLAVIAGGYNHMPISGLKN